MKRILAVIVAIMMALGCLGAFAETNGNPPEMPSGEMGQPPEGMGEPPQGGPGGEPPQGAPAEKWAIPRMAWAGLGDRVPLGIMPQRPRA